MRAAVRAAGGASVSTSSATASCGGSTSRTASAPRSRASTPAPAPCTPTRARVEGGTALRRWEVPLQEKGTAISHRRPVSRGCSSTRNVPLEEYKFVAGVAKNARQGVADRARPHQPALRPSEFQGGLPGHGRVHGRRGGDPARRSSQSLVDAGCRYVHIDAPGYTAYVDEPSMKQMRERGEDPRRTSRARCKADAALIAGFPGVTFGIHLCRGNQRSMWHREGSYDAIAERLFNELPHHRFLLEYDSPRAGCFAPLRFVPKGKVVVLGLVSTKVPELETRRRAEAPHRRGGQGRAARAARHQPAVRLRLRRGRQPDQRGRPEAQARAGGRGGQTSLELNKFVARKVWIEQIWN